MIDVLFVSIAFPPKNDPECIQAARYFRYLKDIDDLSLDVVTSQIPTLFMPYDPGLERYDLPVRQKLEMPIYESKLVNYLLRFLFADRLLFPDSKVSFSWHWRRVVRQLKTKPKIIYSRSNPISSAYMAYKLKKYFNCRWIMHLSDPWSASPLHSFSNFDKVMKRERLFFEEAEQITFTSNKTLELYKAAYPQLAYKFSVLPNVYDPEDIGQYSFPVTNKLRIVYTGGMTGNRGANFLNQVLAEINSIDPDYLAKLEFLFAGDLDSNNRRFFHDTPWACVQHIGRVPFSRTKSLHQSAHLLLVIDNPTSSDHAIYFPSKILDYFMANKIIWAVTPENSATRMALREYKHAAFSHNECGEMARFLISSIENLKQGNAEYFNAGPAPDLYNAKVMAKKLADLIRRVLD